jgi:hypothetical protein
MSRNRSGPSPLLIVIIGAFLVFGGYYVWTGFINFLENQGDITAPATQRAMTTATAQAAPLPALPTLYNPPTFTALPPCIWFEVDVNRAVYRECPSTDDEECPVREVVTFGTELCIYSRVPNNHEWYVVDLNPDGAYRDTVYIHESVVEAVNPTPTITVTFTPLPTITPTPSHTPPSVTATPTQPSATPTPRPSVTPQPTITPSQTPTPSPLPTLPEISL